MLLHNFRDRETENERGGGKQEVKTERRQNRKTRREQESRAREKIENGDKIKEDQEEIRAKVV